ncbi:acetolactate synthase small subunit [Pedobacter sp. W3I1]|uniref:acetolactate synthase small subunit n=1 Tax=Pedobacter sp. W3I1 TaxID=3042291 RepID=UPI0027D80F7F|nr:acetolactate synthase small subunit [Pedobacter sp. W3I1]
MKEVTEKQEFNISVYSENHVGLLSQIASVFTRRKINIESLNISPSELKGIHRFCIMICEAEVVVRKLLKQIEKLNEVIKVYCHLNSEVIWQELALYKMPAKVIQEEFKVERLLRKFGARVVVIRKDYVVFETCGHREETDNLLNVLQFFGLVEFVRSARIAIVESSVGFHEKLKEFERLDPAHLSFSLQGGKAGTAKVIV